MALTSGGTLCLSAGSPTPSPHPSPRPPLADFLSLWTRTVSLVCLSHVHLS